MVALFGRGPSAIAESAAPSEGMTPLATQRFICDDGSDRNQCRQEVAAIRMELMHYPTAVPAHWSWVIVRSEDWSPLTRKLHLDRRSPAFTAIDERETFLEEALFSPLPTRTSELVRDFHVPFEQLLAVALSHELGHAICHGGDESTANRISDQLRSGKRPDCGKTMKSLTPMEELHLRRQLPGLRGVR
jgi:hypothetical protein